MTFRKCFFPPPATGCKANVVSGFGTKATAIEVSQTVFDPIQFEAEPTRVAGVASAVSVEGCGFQN